MGVRHHGSQYRVRHYKLDDCLPSVHTLGSVLQPCRLSRGKVHKPICYILRSSVFGTIPHGRRTTPTNRPQQNIFTDVLILILPVRTVWNLQMTVRRKIALMVVVGFGAASCLVSMLRLIVLHQFYVNPDFPFILGKMIIISCFEIQVAVIAANMPSMKTLWMARFKEGCLAYGSSGHPSGGAYKLSSMEPPPGKSGGHRHKSNQPMGVRGSVSGLDLSGRDTEPGPNNESLEELFGKDSRIMVTTDIAVNKTAKTMADDAERDADAFTLYGTQKRPQ